MSQDLAQQRSVLSPLTSPLWRWPETTSQRVSLMGILNVTPDSFYDGGQFDHSRSETFVDLATERGLTLIEEGALYIDVGGESSRPGAAPVSIEEELERVIPVIERLISAEPSAVISVDTVKPKVAEAALDAGAKILNDIRGLRDPLLREIVADRRAGVVIMHMRGTPQTMQRGDLSSQDVVEETYRWLNDQLERSISAGIELDRIAIDIGVGFGKTVEQNLQLIYHLERFKALSPSLLIGASRKSFIGAITGASAENRLPGSLATLVEARRRGGNIFRVHDVMASRQALWIDSSLQSGSISAPPLSLIEFHASLER